ncbi:MAG: radical SAM protein [Polyangiaceae bacterium]|nr:radical SAM protein [Polyangiaceae bacterium]
MRLAAKVVVFFGPVRVSPDFIDYPYFADLGAVSCAAALREKGFDVTLVDAFALAGSTLEKAADGDLILGAPLEETLRCVPSAADVIVVALTPFHRPPLRDKSLGAALSELRKRFNNVPILLGDLYQSGQHVVDAPSAEILAAYPEADVLLRFEGERDLPEIVGKLAQSGRPEKAFSQNGVDISPLDNLPFPAWDLVNLPALFRFHERVVENLGRPSWAFPITLSKPTLPAVTSRGCPYRCVHCSSNPATRVDGRQLSAKTQRRHSVEYVSRLFGRLKKLGAERIHLLDELVNVNEAHFDGVLSALQSEGLSFEIPNGVRADYVLDKHLEKMRGRLTTLSISAESGVQHVLDKVVDKQLDLAAIQRVAERAQAAKVPILVHFMIGLPGETKQDINGTLEFALKLFEETGALPSVQFATPLPGTRLARLAVGKVALPVVKDYGPLFQQQPSIETEQFSADFLRRAKWTFDERIRAGSGPKKVIMNVTYRCNNRCTFCATGTRTQMDGDYQKQRELLVKYRKAGVTLLDFDGGEPTLNEKLFSLIAFAKKIGYERINVTTNARMASYGGYAKQLVHSGVTSVLVSIHGPDAQTHAQNVGVAEAFEQTCEGAKNIVLHAPANVEVGANITLTKSNHKKLYEVAELVLSLGMRWLNIQFLTPFGRATNSVTPPTEVAAAEAMRTIDAFKDRMKIQIINLPFCFMPGYEEHLMGDLLKLERHMLFVNNDEVNLFEYLRERRAKKPVCETCPHEVFCGGFYEMDNVPEPTWLIKPEDLVRPIRDDIPTVRG